MEAIAWGCTHQHGSIHVRTSEAHHDSSRTQMAHHPHPAPPPHAFSRTWCPWTNPILNSPIWSVAVSGSLTPGKKYGSSMSPRTRWMSAAIVFRKSYVGRSTTFPVHRMCWILPMGEKRYEREAGGGSEWRMDKCGEAWGWRARISLVSLSSYTPFSYLRSCSVRGVKIGRSPRRPLMLGSRLHSGAVCDHRKWERGAGVVVGSRHVLVAPSPHTPGTSSALNFFGRHGTRCGMCRSPIARTSTWAGCGVRDEGKQRRERRGAGARATRGAHGGRTISEADRSSL